MTLKGIYLFLILLLLAAPITAKYQTDSNLEITSVSDDSITWYYNYTSAPLVAAFDGIRIADFDNQSNYYTASGLGKQSFHTFCIYVETQNCETVNTTATGNEVEQTFSVINLYIFFIIALICLFISAWVKLSAYLSLVFSLMGILQCINNNFYMGIVFVTMTLISIASLGYDRA